MSFEGAGVRVRGGHHEAAGRPAGRRGGRPGGGPPDGDPPLCAGLCRAVPAGGGAALCRRLRAGRDPQSLRILQPGAEIRAAAGQGGGAGVRLSGHRALRPDNGRRRGAAPAQGRRFEPGSELCALPHTQAAAGPGALPPGRAEQGPGAGDRRAGGLPQRPQAGQPGHLLHPGRGLPVLFGAVYRQDISRRGHCGYGRECGGPPPGGGGAHPGPAPGGGGVLLWAHLCVRQVHGHQHRHRGAGGGAVLPRLRRQGLELAHNGARRPL